uniref:Uncharacterized protein n=2 Tax=Nothobranchius TaxID=28779 RepID=A0A1A8MA51_9TELE
MSGTHQDRAQMADSLHLNGTTTMGLQDELVNFPLIEIRVVNIVLMALALCVLAATGLYCVSVCYNHTRQSKRAHVCGSAVSGAEPEDPVEVRAVKRSTSFINPLVAFFRRPEAAKDNSRIYYIYSNPLPVGLKEEEEEEQIRASRRPEEQTSLSLPLSLQEYANDPNSGLVLDPPIFYMQL